MLRFLKTCLPVLVCTLLFRTSVLWGQADRQALLDQQPLVGVAVQSLSPARRDAYPEANQAMMYQAEQEDPLAFYVRTQDGEWLIPPQVNSEDPWVRLLLLGPVRPTLVDVAIEINGAPYRAAREAWIDKLLAEAKATFLVRTGVEVAEAGEVEHEDASADASSESSDAQGADTKSKNEKLAEGADEKANDKNDENSDEKNNEDADEVPMVSAQGRQTRSLFQRLINYLAADQALAEREEVRWLLAEWTGGPAQLTLSPAFAWRRANSAPLWNALDSNRDTSLSSEEIQQAMTTLKRADINRDDIVDLSELERLAQGQAPNRRTPGHPLVVVLDENTDWTSLLKDLRDAYDSSGTPQGDVSLLERLAMGDRSISAANLANLLSLPAELVARVGFAEKDAKLTLIAINGRRSESWRSHASTDQVIALEQSAGHIELSAAQGKVDAKNESGDMQQTQIAIGAVVDGFPLFRLVDRDNNRQLTLRERRGVEALLASLDRDQDGQIESRELPTPIRLAITHGAQVHRHLAQPIAAQRDIGKQEEVKVPDWFVGMDRNQDGDLSQREFQGSPAQFAKFDSDGDGLISRLEAQQ